MSPSKKLVSLVKKLCLKLLRLPSNKSSRRSHNSSSFRRSSNSTTSLMFQLGSSMSPAASTTRTSDYSSDSWDYGDSSPKSSGWRSDYGDSSPKYSSGWRSITANNDSDRSEAGGGAYYNSGEKICACPGDVPQGCLAVYVGVVGEDDDALDQLQQQRKRRRFVIQTEFLHHSLFRALLAKSEEEFGFHNQGGLRISCEPDVFQRLLWQLQQQQGGAGTTSDGSTLN